jgi:all-trans-retinol 13,14-reductase
MMEKSCLIIGSGLGGLACEVGGCLQCFTRRGVKFETGMHFIGSADEGQTLYRLLKYLGIQNKITLGRLNPDGYDVISLQGECFRIANGKEPFIDGLASYFPAERDHLRAYYQLVQQIAEASSLHSLKSGESDMAINTKYQLTSINQVVDEYFDDPLLKSVLVGNLPLYAGEKDKTPFSSHAFIMDFYNQSAFRVVGGSDHISDALVEVFQSQGGELITRQKVTKIVCDETKAVGAYTEDGNFYAADWVITDVHPMRVMELVDSPLIRPAFRRRINAIPNTVGGFSVYLHFKEEAQPYMNYNFYGYRGNSPWGCENYTEENWPKGYLYMHFCHEAQPRYAESGVILSYMTMKEMEPWLGTRVGHRGEDYEQFKKEKAEKLLSVVERDFPGLRSKVKYYYTSSPLTYLDYTGTQDGSMYGIAKDINNALFCRVPHKTKIPNLLLTGQNINSHGMLGVLVGSIVTCSEFLGSNSIYQQIIEANK